VKENIDGAVIGLDKAEALVFVEHLNFPARHAVPSKYFFDFDLDSKLTPHARIDHG
jgi:hypothetical protein